jgi:hypothetical protein
MLFGTVRSKYVMMEPTDPRRKRFRPSARITSEEVFDFLRATGRRKNQSTKGNSGTPEVPRPGFLDTGGLDGAQFT